MEDKKMELLKKYIENTQRIIYNVWQETKTKNGNTKRKYKEEEKKLYKLMADSSYILDYIIK